MIYTSIGHDFQGRKRKKQKVKGSVYERRVASEFAPITKPLYNHRSSGGSEYVSAPDNVGAVGTKATARKAEGYTVAIPYNKGGYSVIPTNEVKYIGK